MDNNNPIKYSDLVKPDNSILDLIKQLDDLKISYSDALKSVNSEAIKLKVSLQNVSGATSGNRTKIRQAATEADKLAAANKQLAFAESEVAKELAVVRKATAEANQMNKLAAKIADTAEGSYNRLSAQYSLNKIVLNDMSAAMRKNTKEGRELEEQTRQIYEEMKNLQSATGMNQLNVGNYPELTEGITGYGDKLKDTLGLNNEFGESLLKLGKGGPEAKSMLTAIGDGAKALGKTLLGLLANPVFLAIAGIAGVGVAFKFWFDYNQGLIEATRLTQQFTGKTGDDLKAYRNEVTAIADVYKKDIKDVLEAANALSKQFGIEQSEALKLIKDGFVSGGDVSGQLLENIKEYPTYFREAGISASGFVAITTQATKQGIFSDKGVDVIKEGNIRIREMTKATKEALDGIGLSSAELQKGLQDGSLTTFDVMQQVSQKLNELPATSAAVGTAIADIFGGPGEDAGIQYLKTLKDIDTDLDSVKTKAGNLAQIQEKQLQSQIELSNHISALFDMTGGSFEEMIGNAKLFINDGLINIIKYTIGTINYFRDLYNESIAFRVVIQGIIAAFKNQWAVVKNLFSFLIENIKISAQAIKGLLTLDFDLLSGAFKRYGENLKNTSKNTVKDISDNIQNGVKNLNKKLEPIKIPVVSNNTPLAFSGQATGSGGGDTKGSGTKTGKPKDATKDLEALYKTNLDLKRKYQDAELALEKDGFAKRRMQTTYNYARQIEDLKHQLETDKKLSSEAKQNINGIISSLEKQQSEELKTIENERQLSILEQQKQGLQLRLESARKGSEQEIALRRELIEKEREIALQQNSNAEPGKQQSESDINAKFDSQISGLYDTYLDQQMRIFDAQQDLAQSEFDLLRKTEGEKTRFKLNAEKERLQKILELNKTAGVKLSDTELKTIQNTISKINQEIDQSSKDEKSKDIYGLFGLKLTDEEKQGIAEATSFAISQISQLLEAKVQAADAALQKAQQETESAKSRVDAEIEARNNGYANNVITAQKELDLARKNEEKAAKDKEKAVKRQQQLDTITQMSSLVTASANIWSSLSVIPIVGPALAVAALGLMWGSFAASKIKAKQASKGEESYGDGTVELLQGGSHQSGNDIDLGTKPNGIRRRAEGGEFFAVINKRNSKRFRNVIPDVIKSFNNGTFTDKYGKAFSSDGLAFNTQTNEIDLGSIGDDVRTIKEQNSRKTYVDGNGNVIETYKNLKRTIKN